MNRKIFYNLMKDGKFCLKILSKISVLRIDFCVMYDALHSRLPSQSLKYLWKHLGSFWLPQYFSDFYWWLPQHFLHIMLSTVSICLVNFFLNIRSRSKSWRFQITRLSVSPQPLSHLETFSFHFNHPKSGSGLENESLCYSSYMLGRSSL